MAAQKQPKILVIGAGMSGILVAMRLLKSGFTDFHIYEKDHDLGGTWRINTYPGIACDVPSHYYTYESEPNGNWSARLPQGAEIQQYLQSIAEKYEVRKYISFNKEVVDCKHDGEQWTIKMQDGETLVRDYVIACCGLLYHPTYPDIDGLDSFSGKAFHSARWDHDTDLSGKKVGLIGNGSTAAQIVSTLAAENVDLKMFLRTPQWIFPLPDRKYTAVERTLTRWFPMLARFGHTFYRVMFENLFAKAVIKPGWQRNLMGWACKRNLKTVKDPALRERLTPDFEPLCKRLVMSTSYYDAIQQDNVSIVDGNIEKIAGHKVFTKDGEAHELDVLIMATGYDAHAYFRPLSMVNAQGMTLDNAWKDGPYALRTVAVPGFPTSFHFAAKPYQFFRHQHCGNANDYIIDCISRAVRGDIKTIDAKTTATNAFNQMVYLQSGYDLDDRLHQLVYRQKRYSFSLAVHRQKIPQRAEKSEFCGI